MSRAKMPNSGAMIGSPHCSSSRIELSLSPTYFEAMKATISSKGRITIPLRLREKLHLHAGDQLEFDENASVLVARRVVNREAWESTLADWRRSCAEALSIHPWKGQKSSAILDDLRGGSGDYIHPDS